MATITQTRKTSESSTTRTRSENRSAEKTASNPNSNSAADKVSLSREASQSGSEGGSVELLKGLKENYGSDKPAQTNEQKIEKLQSTLEGFKGLKGEQLESKLKELSKSDPELAELLKKLLDEKESEQTEEAKKDEKVAEAKPAEKAKGADDGAPSEQFLWKPASESNGKLVILLPSSVTASSVSISGPNVSESGSDTGRANGQRQHFRFGKSGKDMQGPVTVRITLASGGSKTVTVANPAERMEGGELKDSGQTRSATGMPGFGAFAGF